MDEIRCDEPSYLIWKWHPKGSQQRNNNRENAIRWGSSLRVKDGEVAVFVYKQKDGEVQDFIVGPFDQIIKTANLPILASVVGLAYEGGTPFQAEVYFINLAHIIQIKFGVPFFAVSYTHLDVYKRQGQDQYQEVPTGEVEGKRRAMQNHSTEQNGREQLEDQPPSPEAAEYQNEQQ